MVAKKSSFVRVACIRYILLLLFLVNLSHVFSTVFYVSESGSDSNSGTSSGSPWRTLSKVNNHTFRAGDRILFNSGDIFHGTLNIRNSGSISNPIYVGAYGTGAKPKISGLVNLTSWSSYGGGIYRTRVSLPSDVNLLLINNELQHVGRYPNDGYLRHEKSTATSITDYDLPASPVWSSSEVVIKMNGWTITRNPVTYHSGNTVGFVNKSGNNYTPRIGSSYGYFFQRNLKTLDRFGEWYYDGTYMYVYFGSNSPGNYSVKSSSVNDLINIYAAGNIVIDGLQLEGSSQHSLYANINAPLTVQNCDVKFSGTDGIRIKGYANTVNIDNNTIYDTQGFALTLGRSGSTNNSYVGNNVVKDAGLKEGMGGVESSYGAMYVKGLNNIIEYNHVENSGYNGINYFEDGTVVRYNLVDNFNTLIHDGGGIYTWEYNPSNSSGKKVYNNIVLNGTDGNGIYSDGFTDHLEIYNNTVANLKAGFGVLMNNSHNNYVHDNTFYNNSEYQIGVHNLNKEIMANGNVISGNKIITTKEVPQALKFWDDVYTEVFNMGTSNNNYFIASPSYKDIFNTRTNNPWRSVDYNFSEWKQKGYDTNSSIQYSDDIFFKYNATKYQKTVALPYPMIDAKGNKFQSSVILQPYTSVVLLRDPNPAIGNNPPYLADKSISLNGEISQGTKLLTLEASNTNNGQTLSYTITEGNDLYYLYLKSSTGELFTSLKYDTNDALTGTITVKVTDNGDPALSDYATVTIQHSLEGNSSGTVNHTPVLYDQTFNISGEIAPGTLIGEVVASDPDSNQQLDYNIVSGNEDYQLYLNGQGLLYTSLKYVSGTNLSGELIIEVNDNGNPMKSNRASISLIHESGLNVAPVFTDQIMNIDGTVSKGTVLGQVIASDPNKDQSLTYSIVSGNEDYQMWLNSSTGVLYTSLKYESGYNLNGKLTIKVSDNGSPIKSTTADVILNHESNNAPVLSDQIFNVSGTLVPGTNIGSVVASDPDNGQSLSYRIVSGNEDYQLWLNSSTGVLYTSLNYTAGYNLSGNLTIEVTDDGSPVESSRSTITLVHEVNNNAPVINSQTFEVNGGLNIGKLIGEVKAYDPNVEQSLTYRIVSGNDDYQLYLNPQTGALTTSLKYNGMILSRDLYVSVTDNGAPSKTSMALITINHLSSKSGVMGNIETTDILTDTQPELYLNSYPNPFTYYMDIELSGLSDGKGVLRIISLTGEIVREKYYSGNNGSFTDRLLLSDIEPGIYLMELRSGDVKQTIKVIKE